MNYLLNVTETYRVPSEPAAVAIIEQAKSCPDYNLVKYSTVRKEIKSKGEVVDDYYKVSLTKKFNEEKEPESNYSITYVNGAGEVIE